MTRARIGRSGDRGFSLVELMIAITLGLLILAGVLSIFLGSKRGFRTTESVGQVQETGRFLAYVFYPYLRHAGYLSAPMTQITAHSIFRRGVADDVADALIDPPAAEPNPAIDVRRAIWGVENGAGALGVPAVAGTDVIVSRFMGQDQFGGAAADVSLNSCLGAPAASGLRAGHMAENVFFVSAPGAGDPAGVNNLSCRSTVFAIGPTGAVTSPLVSGTNTQPLIQGVQDMEILYGIDPESDGTPNRYVSADAVPDWQLVVSVRITTLVDAPEQTEGADVVPAQPGEGGIVNRRVRREYTNTIQLRNRLRS